MAEKAGPLIKSARYEMAYFQDLSALSYLPASSDLGFKAVGWLERDHDYPKDEVSAEFFESLCALSQHAWNPGIACGGFHRCQFCRFSGGASRFHYKQYEVSGLGSGYLFVPSGETLFVSPLTLVHYIDAHGYCPPDEFQKAVLNCPEMKSAAYFQAILKTSAGTWLQRMNENKV